MSIVYLLQNQHDQYLSKAGEWLEGDAASALYRTEHKDEAINRKVEFTVKNVDLRIVIVKASLRENGTPELSSIAKKEEDKTQQKNHGPLFDADATDQPPTDQPIDTETVEMAAETPEAPSDSTDVTENSEDTPTNSEDSANNSAIPLEPAEQNPQEGNHTFDAQDHAQIENSQASPRPSTDEVREVI